MVPCHSYYILWYMGEQRGGDEGGRFQSHHMEGGGKPQGGAIL